MTRRARRTRAWWGALAAALALALSGCGLGGGLYDTPLPGGADVGDHPMTITADFSDVVDLVPQSSVKVENIAVGRVAKIELNPDGRSARVTLVVRGDLGLPEGTTARLQQTSLLGEKYVALVRPATGSATGAGELHDGSNIGLAATSQVAQVEQVLGALSMVLNGGAVGKFQEISHELEQVSAGRPEEIREFLDSMNVFVTSLDSRKEAITDALDALDHLSITLASDKDKIATALEGLSPGMQVLVEQRGQLVQMLNALDRLSQVTVRTLNASQKNMVRDLNLLEPILDKLAESGDALPDSLQILFTFPFTDAVLDGIKGDYINAFVTANYGSLPQDCTAMGCLWLQDPDWAIDAMGTTGSGSERFTGGGADSADPAASPSGSASPAAGTNQASDQVAGTDQAPDQTDGTDPTDGDQTDAGPTAGGEGSTASQPPSPTLLTPTDSALPGWGQPTVQVPASPSAEGSSGAASSGPTTGATGPTSATSEGD
jgi:phospholipid/cholesterol/gamma-HCH transport system substrate-binding protein